MRYLIILLFLTSCSPIYVFKAGVKQCGLIYNRKPIDDEALPEIKTKLDLIKQTKIFISSLGMQAHGFNYYTVHDEPLSYLLLASKRDKFENYTWWYPIIGVVPYKGFFTKASALEAAKELEDLGYETHISEVDAFSTLGWFDDPILTVALKRSDADLVNLIIHENVHSNFWVPNEVEKNESLANFVGLRGSYDFWSIKLKNCLENECSELPKLKATYDLSAKNFMNALNYSENLEKLYAELSELYKSEKNVLEERDRVIMKYKGIPGIPDKVNNATLSLRKIYYSKLKQMNEEFHNDYKSFLTKNCETD